MQDEQVTRLSYNALTRQYRVARGSLFQNAATLDEALQIISRQSAPPFAVARSTIIGKYTKYIDVLLPKNEGDYIAATRMHLDVTQLPKPLQVNALATEDWNLDSDWYRWIVSIVSSSERGK